MESLFATPSLDHITSEDYMKMFFFMVECDE